MAAASAQHMSIKIEPGIVCQVVSSPDNASASTTSQSDVFDRPSPDVTGEARNWMRYGSLESGSTTLTSVSSTATDIADIPSPSKKRKLSSPKTDSARASKLLQRSTSTQESQASPVRQQDDKVRPRSSIPSSLSVSEYAGQCIEAAMASRLDPYALHEGEHSLLVNAITSSEVTIYLNIRNSILRLWLRNPLCRVTWEEAAGCAKDARFFGLAKVAHKWLSRNGYINFGCVGVAPSKTKRALRQRTIVVVGAGVSGLTAARQLENSFIENEEEWTARGERPRVIVLEGRQRIGGRVYSKPLRSQTHAHMPGELRNTAEMGAMIITGFERGNPLDVVIRGQLGLHYHLLRDALTIYDTNGKPVNHKKDMLNTDLYTDISDRTGELRVPQRQHDTLKGDEDLINRCRDPSSQAQLQLDPLDYDPLKQRKPVSKRGRRVNAPPGTEKLTGRSQIAEGHAAERAVRAAHEMGWKVREGVSNSHTVSLQAIAEMSKRPSLGRVMDGAIIQYQHLLEMDPQDMRLLNWHHANLEYANAAPVTLLSLSGHDQDNGNEFEGAHSEVVGGYTQLPRGLMTLPTKLDVRLGHAVRSIEYGSTSRITCTNGEVYEADEIVMTAPLGVLKSDMIEFNPPLPAWKRGAIEHMGFGLLNKVILVYDHIFWDNSRDMFGLLNEPEQEGSLDPHHYEQGRGRFYLIWNASKISGRPMLIALMAGHAAYQTEVTDTPTLLADISARLSRIFTQQIPRPREVIVTRWRQDPFSRGTYSYIAPWTQPGDYDLMAKSVENLHFAGEATCGTHPATVHGAMLSGLRVAGEVLDKLTGPIELPSPLIEAPNIKSEHASKPAFADNPINPSAPQIIEIPKYYYGKKEVSGPPQKSVCPGDPSYWMSMAAENTGKMLEARIHSVVFAKIGERPVKPAKPGVNPFLIYSKDKWEECKAHCSENQIKIGQNVVRQMLSQWWKALDNNAKQPYIDQGRIASESAAVLQKQWKLEADKWDAQAKRIRDDFMKSIREESNHHS